MADRRSDRTDCRSKEGLEADQPMRALVYGQIGENTGDIDELTEKARSGEGEDLPPNFIKVKQ